MAKNKFIFKLLTTATIAAMGVSGLFAQNGSGYFNQAEELFKAKNYYEASVVFEKYLATEKNSRPRSTPFAIEKKVKGKANMDPHQEVVYQLATCYRMINDYQKAEKYYKESTSFSENSYPAARYWYAVTLRANQNYPEALIQITAFLEKHTQMDELLIAADREMEDLKFIQLQSERVNDQFALQELKGTNPLFGYALAQKTGDTVVFTAVLAEKQNAGETVYMNALFESVDSENPLVQSKPMKIMTGTGVHDGMASFSHDGNTIFFTRWTKNNNQTISAIYVSHRENNSWSKPVKATDPINMEGFNSTQPFLTADGRYLIFSSNREGGSGGYDLWAASLDKNYEVIQVRNMGNVINSGGDEEAPYYHDKSRTLVYSTNGRVGMGGFDLFYTKGNFNLNGWEKPQNAGAPLNSSKDDLYYVGTDEDNVWNTGWVSSDRGSACCLALYSVRENNAQFVNGTVIDCKTLKPLANVSLMVTDLRHTDRILGRYKADTAGRYAFLLHNSAHFKISLNKDDYEPGSSDYNLEIHPGTDTLKNDTICLTPIGYPQKELEQLLKSLEQSSHLGNFAYKKATLNTYTRENLDSLARILKNYPDLVIQVEGYTDGIGGDKYNLNLAQKRVDACIRYLRSRGVPADQLQGKAMGECCPIAPETIDGKDNPAGREMNRRVEYKVIKH